jgi:hypothetical protein
MIRLEFADRLTVGVVDGPRELVSVGRYTPGNWEERLKQAYDECLRSVSCWTRLPPLRIS